MSIGIGVLKELISATLTALTVTSDTNNSQDGGGFKDIDVETTIIPRPTSMPTSLPTQSPTYGPSPLYLTKAIVGGTLAGILVLLIMYIAYGNYSYGAETDALFESFRAEFDLLQKKIKEHGGSSITLYENEDDSDVEKPQRNEGSQNGSDIWNDVTSNGRSESTDDRGTGGGGDEDLTVDQVYQKEEEKSHTIAQVNPLKDRRKPSKGKKDSDE